MSRFGFQRKNFRENTKYQSKFRANAKQILDLLVLKSIIYDSSRIFKNCHEI